MIFCTNCGHKMADSFDFCPECGARAAAVPREMPNVENKPNNLGKKAGKGLFGDVADLALTLGVLSLAIFDD